MRRKCFAFPLFAATFAVLAADPPDIRECIAPADPGGGWDFTCRSIARVLVEEKIVARGIQTVNMAGAGGGRAFAYVVAKRGGDEGLFVAASTATIVRLAQNQFAGMTADKVKWIGAVGLDYGIIAVNKDSRYDSLSALFAALKNDSSAVTFAGASSYGGWDHLKILLTAKAYGIGNARKIRYLSFNNGGDALIQVIGGHLDAFTGDLSEARGLIASGDLKVLAVLSPKRLAPPFEHIPTAKEQGIDYAGGANWRGFYLPGGVSEADYDWWVATLNALDESHEWQEVIKQNGLLPFHSTGKAFVAYIKQQIKDIQRISKDLGIIR